MTAPMTTDVEIAGQLSAPRVLPGPSARPTVIRLARAAKRPRAPGPTATVAIAAAAPAPTMAPAAKTPSPTPKPTPEPTPRPTPRPTPTPVPAAPAAAAPSRSEVKAQIRQAWGGDDDKAISVADCESALNPKAASPNEINLGLWQLTRGTWKEFGGPGDDPRDASAAVQTQVAWRLFSARGWSPWPGCA